MILTLSQEQTRALIASLLAIQELSAQEYSRGLMSFLDKNPRPLDYEACSLPLNCNDCFNWKFSDEEKLGNV